MSRPRASGEQLRQLAARVQAAREDERTSIARELHDELGQTLTAIKFELARIVSLLTQERISVEVIDRLQSLVGLVEIGIAVVKRIATDLRPPILDHLGLAAAVRWEAMAFRARTGLRCRVVAKDERTGLDAERETVLFRIVQESLTNVARHAQASAVDISLVPRRNGFEVRIRDNGRGVSAAAVRNPRAIGLLGMRERAALVGGEFEIKGTRGRGTVVTVHVPFPQTQPKRTKRAAQLR
jgi:signal transduction histidine kinase